MDKKLSRLETLRLKKKLLKNDLEHIEDLLTFDNTRQTMSAFTHGFTDKFLGTEVTPDGEEKTVLKTPEIIKEISNTVKDKVLNKNAVFGFAGSEAGQNILENTLKIGAATFVANYAKRSLSNTSWKKKAIGLALIYVAPFLLRMFREKIEQWQRNRTASSMEKLI